jgi:peptidoglycan/xylan/chitin deacetylase (PgdA/CDA1 family)
VAAKGGERERWQGYLAALKRLQPKAGAPPPPPAQAAKPSFREISGRELPDKVLVLTFDDGPHRVYTEEIKAILQHYQTPAVFFEVGRNLGSVDAAGAVKLGGLWNLTEDLAKGGFLIGNHSYTHAQLNKETGQPLDVEIGETDRLLAAIPGAHSHLFRFPYGARTPVQLEALEGYHLRSVLWNIDSLDWADPVPSSVADRVLRLVAEEKRGIILFHDIHDRAGKVLPGLVEQLRAGATASGAWTRTGSCCPDRMEGGTARSRRSLSVPPQTPPLRFRPEPGRGVSRGKSFDDANAPNVLSSV